jgi:hypothetical protein
VAQTEVRQDAADYSRRPGKFQLKKQLAFEKRRSVSTDVPVTRKNPIIRISIRVVNCVTLSPGSDAPSAVSFT